MIKGLANYVVSAAKLYFSGNGNAVPNGCYSRYAFNEYGDNAFERPDSVFDFSTKPIVCPTITDYTANRLNDLNKLVKSQGASLLVAGYPIADGEYTEVTEDDLIRFNAEIRTKLDCDVISDFRDYLIPYSYFYDTHLHLTDEGCVYRTQLLADEIEAWLKD